MLARFTVDGSLHLICMDWLRIEELMNGTRGVYSELKNLCVWVKNNAGMESLYRSQHGLIFMFKNGTGAHRNNVRLGQFGRNRTNVRTYPGAPSFSRSGEGGKLLEKHPTLKNLAMVADAIVGDLVLDKFIGSGTTIIAAERTGRRSCGIEIDPLKSMSLYGTGRRSRVMARGMQ